MWRFCYEMLKFYQIALFVLLLLSSCGSKSTPKDADSVVFYSPVAHHYHADNDIAMTVRSIVDALKVGEPLNSTEYDFNGVLTDGQGSPIYTDVQGAPGLWVVDIIDKTNATIKNVYLGDLLPDDLQSYLLQSLRLDDKQPVDFSFPESEDDDETDIEIYDFGGGYLRFETRSGIAPNGLEGPLLTIVMSTELPSGIIVADSTADGKQTTALAQSAAKP